MTMSLKGKAMADIRYINKVADDGWINGLEDKTGTLLPLCKYTKLEMRGSKAGRTNFLVLDGAQRGKLLSMKDGNAATYIGTTAPSTGVASVTVTYGKYVEGWVSKARRNQKLDQQFATLKIGRITAEVTMNTVWGTGFYPLKPGSYNILVPDAPHKGDMTTFYRNVAPSLVHDQVWFPIEFGDNSRYVHVGNLSDGCTTVVSLDMWPDICEALISNRSVNGKYVGLLTIKGKPERES